MLAWVSILLPIATLFAIIALLGLPVAWALRARGFAVALITIPAAFAVLALSSFLTPFLGIRWTILPPLMFTIALSLGLFVLRRYLGIRNRQVSGGSAPNHGLWIPVAAAAVGGVTIAAAVALAFKTPDAISQTYDVNFHLNAVRMILDEGSASPLDMDLSAPGYDVFYPTLWHAAVTLIVQISGVSIPLASNAALIVTVATIWTIGMVGLGRAIAGPSMRVTVVSGILSVAIPSFPLALTGYGILYPNLLSIALLPYFLVGFMQFFGIAQARRSDAYSTGSAALLILGSFGASCLAHPNALHALLIWLIGPVIFLVVRAFRGLPVPQPSGGFGPARLSPRLRKVLASLSVPALAIAIGAAWFVGRTSDAPWGGEFGPRGAAIEGLGMSPHLEGNHWALSVIVLIGALVAVRLKSLRWAFIPGALFLGLYIISDGFPPADWRTMFLTPWYNTPWRLSALAWLGAFPFMVLGASAAWSLLRGGLVRWAHASRNPRAFFVAGSTAAALFLLAASQGAGAESGMRYVASKYESSVGEATLLDEDERALLERLSEKLPDDAVIIDNPWNGGALAYAISGISVLVPHTGGNYDPRILELSSQLKSGTPRACELAEEFGAKYILDFGTRYVFEGTRRAEPFIGVTDVSESNMFTEIDREGEAVLYELTGCD